MGFLLETKKVKAIVLTMVVFTLGSIPTVGFTQDKELVVYSARKEHLIKPLFEMYTKKTGVKIAYTTGKAGALLERLKAEGKNSPADIFMTVDAGNLWQAEKAGVLQPIESEVLESNVPANLRDPGNSWFGLSVRARTMVYNTEKVDPAQLSSYEALAGEEWHKKLILRTSKKIYNQSLVASLIADHGPEKAKEVVGGWVKNLAAAPFSNDTKSLEAVALGLGEVTVVNTYYFGRLMKKKPTLPLAIYWPNQDTTGVHVNVSGAGLTAAAKHPKEAQALLEWLSSPEAQLLYGSLNMEYPVNKAVAYDDLVSSWGLFKANPVNVAKYGELQADAIKLMDNAGYK